jgi:hypothetical protein
MRSLSSSPLPRNLSSIQNGVVVIRLFHFDQDVRDALARLVGSSFKPLLITRLSALRTIPVEKKTPFKEVLACAGERVELVVLIDDGSPEGMWRDPLGELSIGSSPTARPPRPRPPAT